MKELKYSKLLFFLGILTVLNVVIYIGFRNKTYFDFLNWNLFLAWIPLLISGLAFITFKRRNRSRAKSFLVIMLGMAWLLFFPNSPYVITDLIHLTIMKHAYVDKGKLTFEYWSDLIVILIYSWTSLLLGAASTYQIQYMIAKAYHKIISWCFIAATSVLGGYGILLGREHRLNSWDVLGDWRQVYEIIRGSFTGESILFCLLFAFFIAVVYVTFYVLINSLSKSDR